MTISLKSDPNKKYFVYAIYWGNSCGKFQRLHYVVEPDDDVGGFSPLAEDEISVFESSLNNYTLIKDLGVGDVFVHNSALPLEGLFDGLCENGYPEKVEKLFKNMRAMGLEP